MNVPSSAELAAAAEARRPKGKNRALDGVRLDTGTASNSGGSRPAKKTAGIGIDSWSGHVSGLMLLVQEMSTSSSSPTAVSSGKFMPALV
jgi:hypothetical protein